MVQYELSSFKSGDKFMKTKLMIKITSLLTAFSSFTSLGICSTPQELAAEKTPAFLYKVLSLEDWKKSQGRETLQLSSADAEFIHFSREDQLDRIIQKYWAGDSEYVVLKVETAKLPGKLVFETNPGGTAKYYHLYDGSIPLDSVEIK